MMHRSFKRLLSFPMACLLICAMISGCGDDQPAEQPQTGTMVDIEGRVYKTVRIGNQWWMAEDLKVGRFTNGDLIPNIQDPVEWANTTSPGYCFYNNAPTSASYLYNYHVLTSGKNIAPFGWRVATDEDWKELEEYLGMPVDEINGINWRGTVEGDKLKVETTSDVSGWPSAEGVWGNNDSGFTAFGGSCRVFSGEWGVPGTTYASYWWTSTQSEDEGWFRYLDYQKSGIFRYVAHPNYGFSIRCVKE